MCFSILVTPKQLDILKKASKHTSRANVFPVLRPIVNPKNVDSVDVTKDADGNRKEVEITSELLLSEGQLLLGVIEHGQAEVTNMSPESLTVKVIDADGTESDMILLPGENAVSFFEGTFFACYLPACADGPARLRVCADRQVISNFCGLYAAPLKVKGSDVELTFSNVEALFQMFKAILTGDDSVLEAAVGQKKPGGLKQLMGKVKVPDSWFSSMSEDAMRFSQFWAATCPVRFATLGKIVSTAASYGVNPEDTYIHEYGPDRIYGTACLPGDVRPLFKYDFVPKGGNVMGSAITAVARKVAELGTHEAYVSWFEGNFAPVFVLEEEAVVVLEEEAPATLGARTSSQANLSVPEARTSSKTD